MGPVRLSYSEMMISAFIRLNEVSHTVNDVARLHHFASIMDCFSQPFSSFMALLFGAMILGMLWERATNSAALFEPVVGTLTLVGIRMWIMRDRSALCYVVSPSAHKVRLGSGLEPFGLGSFVSA